MANLEAYGDKLIGVIASSGGGGGGGDVANYILTIPTTGYTEQSVEIWGETKTVQVITLTTDKDGIPLSDFTSSMIVDYPINIDGTLTDFAKLYAHEIGNGSVTFYFTSIPSESFNVLVRQAVSSEAPVPPGPDVPDGRTVTPTDDIQIWLNCADIWDKSYTTLYEVLNDTATLSALMASDNAVDYLVRSTSWAVPITVPVMTSNTEPSGICLCDSNISGEEAYKAFDKNNSTNWESNIIGTAGGQWLGYKFSTPQIISYLVNRSSAGATNYVKVQYSDDDVNWVDTGDTYNIKNSDGDKKVSLTVDSAHYSYRIYCTSASSNTRLATTELNFYSPSISESADAMTYIGQNNYCANTLLADETWCNAICNSEYFESVLNVKVPVMTSNTTPSGEVIFSNEKNATYAAWKSFDSDATTQWEPNGTTGNYVGYDFGYDVRLVKFSYKGINNSSYSTWVMRDFKIQGSADKVTFDDVESFTYTASPNNQDFQLSKASSPYRCFRQYCVTGAGGADACVCELKFYGRKDI